MSSMPFRHVRIKVGLLAHTFHHCRQLESSRTMAFKLSGFLHLKDATYEVELPLVSIELLKLSNDPIRH